MARAQIGLRIKKQRKSIGVTQAQLAKNIGISASYLNLIENNKRAIGGKLLKKIAEELEMTVTALDGESDRRLILELHELTSNPLFEDMDLSLETATNFVGQHPRWAGALRKLYRTYLEQSQTINALTEKLNYAPYMDDAIFRMLTNATAIRASSEILRNTEGMNENELARFHNILTEESQKLVEVAEGVSTFMDNEKLETTSMSPSEEVDDFMLERGGYFDELETAAKDLAKQTNFHHQGADGNLQNLLTEKFQIQVKVGGAVSPAPGRTEYQCGYNEDTRELTVPNYTSYRTLRYEMACLLVELSLADVISNEIKKSDLLISSASQTWAAKKLIDYLAHAFLMPYDAFLEDAILERYDVDVLSLKYKVNFHVAASRVASLKKRGAEGIPFALMHTNPAGHVLRRMTLPSLPIPRYGSACPLWDIYRAFQTTDRIVRQLAVFPNNERFLFFAKAEASKQAGFSQPRVPRATMLACEAQHAAQTVYGDGLDTSSDQMITKVGLNCHLCTWGDCVHREKDPILSQ